MDKKIMALMILALFLLQVSTPLVVAQKAVKPDAYGKFKHVKQVYLSSSGDFTDKKKVGNKAFLLLSKDMDDVEVHFNKVTKRLAVSLKKELKKNEDGWVVEKPNGTVLLNKEDLADLFGSVDDVALKKHFFKTVTVNGSKYWEIQVDDVRDCDIVLEKFVEPKLHEKWFTRGSNSSIRLADRAMYIEMKSKDDRGFVLDFDHPVDHSGQKVYVNKSWLVSQGISHPMFSWGEKNPWKPLGYKDMGSYYVLSPEHFSTIGIHEKANGETDAWTYGYKSNEILVNSSNVTGINTYVKPTIDSFSTSSTSILNKYFPIFNPIYRHGTMGWQKNYASQRSLVKLAPRDGNTMAIYHSGGYFYQSNLDLRNVDVLGFEADAMIAGASYNSDIYEGRTVQQFYDIYDYRTSNSKLKFYGYVNGDSNKPSLRTYLNSTILGDIEFPGNTHFFDDYHSLQGFYIGNIRTYTFDNNSAIFSETFNDSSLDKWNVTSLNNKSGVKSDITNLSYTNFSCNYSTDPNMQELSSDTFLLHDNVHVGKSFALNISINPLEYSIGCHGGCAEVIYITLTNATNERLCAIAMIGKYVTLIVNDDPHWDPKTGLALNTWHRIYMTFANNLITLYADGNIVATRTADTDSIATQVDRIVVRTKEYDMWGDYETASSFSIAEWNATDETMEFKANTYELTHIKFDNLSITNISTDNIPISPKQDLHKSALELVGNTYVQKNISLNDYDSSYDLFLTFNYRLYSLEDDEELKISFWNGHEWKQTYALYKIFDASDDDNVWHRESIWIPYEYHIQEFKFKIELANAELDDYVCLDDIKIVPAYRIEREIFYDDFESGTLSNWTSYSGASIHATTSEDTFGHYDVRFSEIAYMSSKTIDLSQCDDPTYLFINWKGVYGYQYFNVSIYDPDSSEWIKIYTNRPPKYHDRVYMTEYHEQQIAIRIPETLFKSNVRINISREIDLSYWIDYMYITSIYIKTFQSNSSLNSTIYWNSTNLTSECNLTRVIFDIQHSTDLFKKTEIYIKNEKDSQYVPLINRSDILSFEDFENYTSYPIVSTLTDHCKKLEGSSYDVYLNLSNKRDVVVSFDLYHTSYYGSFSVKAYNGVEWSSNLFYASRTTIDRTGATHVLVFIPNKYLSSNTTIRFSESSSGIGYIDNILVATSNARFDENRQGNSFSLKIVHTPCIFDTAFISEYDIDAINGHKWVEETNRSIGVNFETNHLSTTTDTYNLTGTFVAFVIPVSSDVKGVFEVILNGNSMSEVSSFTQLSGGTYYFDAANHNVTICVSNAFLDNYLDVYVNCTYGGTFALTLPKYLRSGNYFMSRGLIKDADGNPISGLVATTTIYAQNGTPLLSVEWNCSNGNYQATIATNDLAPAYYDVEVKFTDMASGVTFKYGDVLVLGVPLSGGGGSGDIYSEANLYYSFVDANTGSKLEDDFYKFYISETTSFSEASRVIGGRYPVTLGKTYYYKVLDYWNNTVYPTNGSYASVFIDEAEKYVDIFIPLHQFKIKNTNDSVAYIRLTNGPINGSENTWYPRWIPPYESTEIFLRSGVYNMTVQLYDVDDITRLVDYGDAPVKILYVENLTINNDMFYWIPGYKIGDIIISVWNTNSSIMDQIINIGVYVKNMNSSVINQIVNSTYLVENINTSIQYQTVLIKAIINNTESNITNQLIVMQQNIDNSFANITNQTNYIWQEINNTNASILNQTNTLIQHINNTNATILAQLNTMIQDIYNYIILESSRNLLPGTVALWSFDNETFTDDRGIEALETHNVSFESNGKFGGAANFTGSESYVHVSNDLSLVNGSIEAWFKGNFSNSTSRGIVYKNNSYALLYNNSNNTLEGILFSPISEPLREYANDTLNNVYAWWYPDIVGQTFTVGTTSDNISFMLSHIRVKVAKKAGLQGTVYCNLTAVNESGFPTGPVLSSGSMDLDDWNDYIDYSSFAWESFNMTPVILHAGKKYAIYIEAPNSTSSKSIYWASLANVYPSGNVFHHWSGSWANDGGDVFFEVYANTNDSYVSISFTPDNNWHHVVFTWDGQQISLYLDGNLVDSAQQNVTPIASSSPVYIGRTENVSESWQGLIDEVVFYDRCLSYADVEYRYTGYTPFYQWNIMLQSVDNANSTIHAQINTVNQNIINTNSTIHNQLSVLDQKIVNANSTIHNQLSIVLQRINNTNSTIHTQLNSIVQDITNMNNSITYQFNGITQQITNVEDNITGQVNSIWLSVNNTNSSMHNQLNIMSADITNMNTSIHTQINAVMAQVENVETNITNQTNLIGIKITNTETNITNQINGVNITIVNHNSTVMNQLNAIMSKIINTNASIIDQVNLIWNEINNTNSSINVQLNAVQNDINNANATIHTQLNVVSTQITNTETNITEQLNVVNVKITNTETNITNQINGVNITIVNHNSTVMNQLNAIMTKIINTNTSMINQINLIWNEINNTNSSIQVQLNGIHSTITTFWSNVNYSFTVIQSDVSYHNTTIVNLIDDMNASLYAKLANVLDNVSEAGESVFDKAMDILEKMGNLTSNVTLNDRLINILDDISYTRTQILNKTLDILDVLGDKVNNLTLGNVVWDVLENITSMQQQMSENFSYVNQVSLNLTNETLAMLDEIYDALLDVNATAMKDLYDILQDVLEQFRLPHEWRIPNVNYTLNDTMPPTSTISALVTMENKIQVSWSSVDNIPLNVQSVTLYYKVENASYWKLWKQNQPSTGSSVWQEEDPVEGKTYYFMALARDANGNNETESDSNTCSIVYQQYVLPISGTQSFIERVGLSGSLLTVIVIILVLILGILVYVGFKLKKRGEV